MEDLEELRNCGAKIDKDGNVTLYHRTSLENAQSILATDTINDQFPCGR